MVHPLSVELARILDDIAHILNSPLLETAWQEGQKFSIDLNIWVNMKPEGYLDRVEYHREVQDEKPLES